MTRKSLAILLILSLSFTPLAIAETQTKTEYVLALEGPTWKDSIINVLITPPSNESWWNPAYLNATLHAISEWNDAIAYFAANHTDFAYLSQLRMAPQVSNSSTNAEFESYVSWTDEFESNVTCEAGLSKTTYDLTGVITNNSITIAAHDCYGNVLNEADSQNVVLHELGHMLGLGHSNYTGDLMYYAYTLGSPVRAISTLDLYGVGTVFRWMASSLEFDQANQGTPVYSDTLPPDIAYEYLPISEKNLPPQSTLDVITTTFLAFQGALSQLDFWVFMGLLTVAAIAGYVVLRRVRRRMISRQLELKKAAT